MKDRVLAFLQAAAQSGHELALPSQNVKDLLKCTELAFGEIAAAEREACSKIAEDFAKRAMSPWEFSDGDEIAAAIRATESSPEAVPPASD